MENIMESVIGELQAKAEETSAYVERMADLEGKISSKRYTQDVVNNELKPGIDQAKRSIESMKAETIASTDKLIDAYINQLRAEDDLNPDDLNDDVKLFNAGITLNARDIEALLKRNGSNRTMVQVILRYAKEHGIPTSNIYMDNTDAIRNAESFRANVKLYVNHWLGHADARNMIRKMFIETMGH